MKTIAIIPAYDEERTIREVIMRCKEVNVFPLVINDCSDDNTEKIAKELTAVISHKRNMGKGESLKSGFQYIEKLNIKYVVVIDGDLQFNPREIPRMITALKDADYIIGQRDNNG